MVVHWEDIGENTNLCHSLGINRRRRQRNAAAGRICCEQLLDLLHPIGCPHGDPGDDSGIVPLLPEARDQVSTALCCSDVCPTVDSICDSIRSLSRDWIALCCFSCLLLFSCCFYLPTHHKIIIPFQGATLSLCRRIAP